MMSVDLQAYVTKLSFHRPTTFFTKTRSRIAMSSPTSNSLPAVRIGFEDDLENAIPWPRVFYGVLSRSSLP
jgi:hypothetical protein